MLAALISGCGAVNLPERAVVPGDARAVHVKLDSAVPARLVRVTGDQPTAICEAPCNRAVDVAAATFRVESPEYEPTRDFEIPASKRGVVVRYGADAAGESLGVGLLVVPGVTAAAIGGTLMLLDASGRDDFDGATIPGAILIGAGVSVAIGGFVVWALARSNVTIEEAAKKSARGFTWD